MDVIEKGKAWDFYNQFSEICPEVIMVSLSHSLHHYLSCIKTGLSKVCCGPGKGVVWNDGRGEGELFERWGLYVCFCFPLMCPLRE